MWHDPPGSRFKAVPWLGRFMDRVERVIDWVHRVYGVILEWALDDRHRRIYVPTMSAHKALWHWDRSLLRLRWVTITNQSGGTYRDAALKLVAGEINRAGNRDDLRRSLEVAAKAAAPAVAVKESRS